MNSVQPYVKLFFTSTTAQWAVAIVLIFLSVMGAFKGWFDLPDTARSIDKKVDGIQKTLDSTTARRVATLRPEAPTIVQSLDPITRRVVDLHISAGAVAKLTELRLDQLNQELSFRLAPPPENYKMQAAILLEPDTLKLLKPMDITVFPVEADLQKAEGDWERFVWWRWNSSTRAWDRWENQQPLLLSRALSFSTNQPGYYALMVKRLNSTP